MREDEDEEEKEQLQSHGTRGMHVSIDFWVFIELRREEKERALELKVSFMN